jgi:hypothetical protein
MIFKTLILISIIFFSACSSNSDSCCTIEAIETNVTVGTNTTVSTPQPVYQPVKPHTPVLEVIEPQYTVKAYSSTTGKHLNNKLTCGDDFIVECNKPCSISIKAFYKDTDDDKYIVKKAIEPIILSAYVTEFELLKSCNCVNFLEVTTNFEDNKTTKFDIKID